MGAVSWVAPVCEWNAYDAAKRSGGPHGVGIPRHYYGRVAADRVLFFIGVMLPLTEWSARENRVEQVFNFRVRRIPLVKCGDGLLVHFNRQVLTGSRLLDHVEVLALDDVTKFLHERGFGAAGRPLQRYGWPG